VLFLCVKFPRLVLILFFCPAPGLRRGRSTQGRTGGCCTARCGRTWRGGTGGRGRRTGCWPPSPQASPVSWPRCAPPPPQGPQRPWPKGEPVSFQNTPSAGSLGSCVGSPLILGRRNPPPYRGSAGRARGGGRGAGAGVPGALPGDRRGRRPTRPHRCAPAPPQHMTGAQCFTTARVCARAQLSPAGV